MSTAATMGRADAEHPDALVVFGFTGDPASKKIFPAPYAMARKGTLTVPVIGLASSNLSIAEIRQRVRDSLKSQGGIEDNAAFERLLSLLHYCSGDYRNPDTFAALKTALGGARRPAHYLAITPHLLATVIQGLGAARLAKDARVIVEKPFGRDLGKEAIMNILYLRFANSFLEPILNRDHVASVQITLAEDFGIGGCGGFYETAGCLRDVVDNHLFQIVALLAMDPPACQGDAAVHSAKASIFRAMRPLAPDDLVRGQDEGYRHEKDVAADSDVETFCALRLFIDSWRWAGVPWYLRSGKKLATEVRVQWRASPQQLSDDARPADGRANYLRIALHPIAATALAARVKRPGHEFVGDQRELYLCEAALGDESPYERLLGDAIAGDGALFTSQEAVEAAWAAVDPVLVRHHRALPYPSGSWDPATTDSLVAPPGGWHNPEPESGCGASGPMQ